MVVMSHKTPLETLTGLVATLEREQRLRLALDRVRRIDENPESTLKRLLEERAAIVQLLRQVKAPSREFDYEYKENLDTVLRSLLAPHLAVANATEP